MLQEWRIDKKVFSIILDDTYAKDSYVRQLKQTLNMKKALLCEGKLFHMYCCAHILNLIVQDGLEEIIGTIQKIQDSVKYFSGSQVRKQNFLYDVNQMSLDSNKRLRQDMLTR
jgi:hypothetical protein